MYHWISLGLFSYSFYALVSFILLPALHAGHSSWAYSLLAFAGVIGVLWVKTFFRLMNENPGYLERKHQTPATLEEIAEIKGETEETKGERPYCSHCDVMQPERVVHCSGKRKCVRRYDRYCAWVNNCIGLYTHKFFVMFLFYTALWSFLVALLFFPKTRESWRIASKERTSEQKMYYYLGIWAMLEGMYHVYWFFANVAWLTANLTYVEWTRHLGRIREFGAGYLNPYDLSAKENIRQVMGSDVINYLNPWSARIEFEGLVYPKTNIPEWNDEKEREKRAAVWEEPQPTHVQLDQTGQAMRS